MTRRWRIYYDDREPVSDGNVPLECVPGWGVQAIAYEREDGTRALMHGFHFYWWDAIAQEWTAGDATGREDYLAQPGWKKIINGRVVRDSCFKDVLKIAVNDPYIRVAA